MAGQLVARRCAGSVVACAGVKPQRSQHILLGGPDGHAGWLVQLRTGSLLDALHPARARARLAAIDPVEFGAALDDLAHARTEPLEALGFTVIRTE
jgi:hypothetical protein